MEPSSAFIYIGFKACSTITLAISLNPKLITSECIVLEYLIALGQIKEQGKSSPIILIPPQVIGKRFVK